MSTKTPLVSIIIPTFNRAHLIGETLDSVLAQTYKNWECIVVDDGSTDSTDALMAEYVAKDARFQYHHRPKDRLPGGNAARNYGFEVSKGEYVQWFDDDDLMKTELLDTMLKNFESGLNLVIVGYCTENGNLEIIEKVDLKVETNLFKDYILWKFKIITGSVIFRKAFLYETQLFNEDILRGQEAEFFSRLFFDITSSEYSVIDLDLFYYRQHAETKSTANIEYIPKFRKDQISLLIENFKRTLTTSDIEFKNKLYRGIVMKFFQAIENNSQENGRFIIMKMTPIVRRTSMYSGLKFCFLGHFSLLISKKSDKVKSHLLTIRFV